jgi:hypothetical protein
VNQYEAMQHLFETMQSRLQPGEFIVISTGSQPPTGEQPFGSEVFDLSTPTFYPKDLSEILSESEANGGYFRNRRWENPAERPMDVRSDLNELADRAKETDSILASHQERLDNSADILWRMEHGQKERMERLERRLVENFTHLTKWLAALEDRLEAMETRLPEGTRPTVEVTKLRLDRLAKRVARLEGKKGKEKLPDDAA